MTLSTPTPWQDDYDGYDGDEPEPIVITKPGIYPGIPDEVYHADPVAAGSLSSTGARQILSSPAWFRYRQAHRETSKPFDVGHAVHAKVLGIGMKVALIPDDLLDARGGISRKDCKAWIDQTREDGRIPLKRSDFYPVEQMAEAILAHPTAKALLDQPGTPEASIFAVDPATKEWVRARFDYLPDAGRGRTVAVDLKTTSKSADPRRFRDSVARYGYHQQDPWYCDALRLTRGDDAVTVFVAVESHEPWLVSVNQLAESAREKGRELNRAALDRWHQCRQSGLWPAYGDEIHVIDLPVWAMTEEVLDDAEDA